MGKEILTLGNIQIEKKKTNKFYHHKTPILLEDVETGKVLVSDKISFSKKNVSTLLVTCTIIIKLSHCI